MTRQGVEVSIATSVLALVLAMHLFSAHAFHFSSQQHHAIMSSVLFSQRKHDYDKEKDELIRQLSKPRYEGGMIKPVVIAAKSEETSSNFMRVNGQDTNVEQRDSSNRIWDFNAPRNVAESTMFRPSGMFRPTVRKSYSETSTNTIPKSREELKSINGDERTEKKDCQTMAADSWTNEELEEMKQNEDTVDLSHSERVRFEKLGKDAEAVIREDEELVDSRKTEEKSKISSELKEGESKIAEEGKISQSQEIRIENETKDEKEYEEIERENVRYDSKSNQTEGKNRAKAIEVKKVQGIARGFDASKINADKDADKIIRGTQVDVSAMEKEEAAKLNAIQDMIEKRREQQAELDKIEEELLIKANEIKNKREELMRLEDELTDVEHKIRNNRSMTEAIETSKAMNEIPHYSPKEYNKLTLEQKMKLKEDRAALANLQEDEVEVEHDGSPDKDIIHESAKHPILGPVVADLGYKRIHIVSSGRLGTIPIWRKQRTYDFDRVKRMAVDKTEQMHLGFPGVICLHEDSDGKLSILDGQHRVGMMQLLRKNRNEIKKIQIETKVDNEDKRRWIKQEQHFQNLLVEVYSELAMGNATETTIGHDFAKDLFLEINKAKPISQGKLSSK